jgi:gas vesicle protein
MLETLWQVKVKTGKKCNKNVKGQSSKIKEQVEEHKSDEWMKQV